MVSEANLLASSRTAEGWIGLLSNGQEWASESL
jgi:hypothetical protein